MRKPNSPDLTLPAGVGVRNGIHIKLGRPASWSVERCLGLVKICGIWACWKAPSALRNGYARLSVKNRSFAAHRVIYEYLIGPVSSQLTLDHLCRNRWCVNPNHLEPVPESVNIQRGSSPSASNALKKVCLKGHPYSAQNTGIKRSGKGRGSGRERYCLICNRDKCAAGRRAQGIKPRRTIPYAEIVRLRLSGKTYTQIKNILRVDANAIARAIGENALPHTHRLKRFTEKHRV